MVDDAGSSLSSFFPFLILNQYFIMKVLLKILATITLVISMFGALLLTIRNAGEASSLAEDSSSTDAAESMMNAMGMGSMLGDLPSAGEFQFAMVLSLVLMLGSLVAIVATFLKSKKFGLVLAGLVALVALLLIIFEPSLTGSLFAGKDPKPVAMVIGTFGIVGAALLGLLKFKFSDPAPTTAA
jgi:hypothetical protein